MNPTRCVTAFFCLSVLAACQSTVGVDIADPPGTGGAGAGDPLPPPSPAGLPISCELPPDGETFTFTVRNTGTRDLSLDFGCFDTAPIAVDGLGIAPGAADLCGIDCREVWDGYENLGCSTICGTAGSRPLPAGGAIEIPWDRRGFVEHVGAPECTGQEEAQRCALGQSMPTQGVLEAQIEVCPHDELDDGDFYACDADEEVFDFTVDLGAEGVVVEVE